MTTTYIINGPADILDAAADEIETNGWHQHGYISPTGNLCVMGAIRKATYGAEFLTGQYHGRSWENAEHQEAAIEALAEVLNASVSLWNDQVCDSAGTAIETLRQTAKKCREDTS
jgi:carbohydrate-selective porin OprB